MTAYTVTIRSADGRDTTFPCGGFTDQEALIYAGKIVEKEANREEPEAAVIIRKDGEPIGVPAVVRDMITKAV